MRPDTNNHLLNQLKCGTSYALAMATVEYLLIRKRACLSTVTSVYCIALLQNTDRRSLNRWGRLAIFIVINSYKLFNCSCSISFTYTTACIEAQRETGGYKPVCKVSLLHSWFLEKHLHTRLVAKEWLRYIGCWVQLHDNCKLHFKPHGM